jgi:hypothetical protein
MWASKPPAKFTLDVFINNGERSNLDVGLAEDLLGSLCEFCVKCLIWIRNGTCLSLCRCFIWGNINNYSTNICKICYANFILTLTFAVNPNLHEDTETDSMLQKLSWETSSSSSSQKIVCALWNWNFIIVSKTAFNLCQSEPLSFHVFPDIFL